MKLNYLSVQKLTDVFNTLYAPAPLRWSNTSTVVDSLGWGEHTTQTGLGYFTANGVNALFANELIGASTRVNYAQNVDEIHGLGAAVSLASDNAASIQGGNWQVFSEFVKRSGARLLSSTEVKIVSKSSSGQWAVVSTAGTKEYNTVLLAAPAHNSGLVLPGSPLPKVEYIRLHVTLLATSVPHANASYFGFAPGKRVPETILTAKGVDAFNSMTYHGRVKNATTGEPIEPPQWVVKIFSMDRMDDEWLGNMFDDQVHWILRKEWDSYPVLPPRTDFPPVKLDDGFYYINAFEPLISTMETETIAARNVVELMLVDQFDTPGLCPPSPEGRDDAPSVGDGFVYGWDCQ